MLKFKLAALSLPLLDFAPGFVPPVLLPPHAVAAIASIPATAT
jgi:hypothetical protein